MNIGFDAKRAFFNRSGLGNYSRNVINSLGIYFSEHRYFLYVPKANIGIGEKPLFQPSDAMQVRTPPTARDALLGGSAWRSIYMGNQIRRDRLDIYHGLSHELPLNVRRGGAKNVVTIHDLIFLRHPQLYSFFDRLVYQQKYAFACRVADRIVAISQATKNDIVQYWGIDPQKISVINPSCHPDFYDYGDQMMLQHGFFVQQEYPLPYQLPDQYVLHIGGMQPRKNLLSLLKAVVRLRPRLSVPIVALNYPPDSAYADSVAQYIAQNDLRSQVILLDYVAQTHLPALYRCAAAVVYPSIAEGWGYPIVEGLCSRVPVIAAKGLEEAGGSHTQYIDPDDTEQFAHTLEKVLTVGSLRMDMILHGWGHAQQFRPDIIAPIMMNLYREMMC